MACMLSLLFLLTFHITNSWDTNHAPYLSYFRQNIHKLSNNSLTVKYSEDQGYHLYTTKDIDEGVAVLEVPCSNIIGVYDEF